MSVAWREEYGLYELEALYHKTYTVVCCYNYKGVLFPRIYVNDDSSVNETAANDLVVYSVTTGLGTGNKLLLITDPGHNSVWSGWQWKYMLPFCNRSIR